MSFTVLNSSFSSALSNGETLVHQWIFEDKVICLTKKVNDLAYIIKDQTENKVFHGSVPLYAGLTQDQFVDCLVDCHPNVCHGQLHFTKNQSVCLSWSWQDKKLLLLKAENYCMWQFIDRGTKTTSYCPGSHALLRVFDPSHYLCNILHYINYDYVSVPVVTSMEENGINRSYEKFACFSNNALENTNLKITKLIFNECCPVYINIEQNQMNYIILNPPYKKKSHFDVNFVDKDNYEITLLNTGNDWHGHAVLIIETVENYQYHMYRTHLRLDVKNTFQTLPGVVRWQEIQDPKTSKYFIIKSWSVCKKNVENMYFQINKQLEEQNQGKVAVYFNARGFDDSYVGTSIKVQNCMTWAKDMLHFAGIELGEVSNAWMYVAPKDYQSQQMKEFQTPFLERQIDNINSFAKETIKISSLTTTRLLDEKKELIVSIFNGEFFRKIFEPREEL